jgi:hypothetical protein
MTHPYSPSPRWLVVPGISFPQNVSGAPDVIATFRYGAMTAFTEGRKLPSEVVRRDDQDDLPLQLVNCWQRSSSWLSFLARR